MSCSSLLMLIVLSTFVVHPSRSMPCYEYNFDAKGNFDKDFKINLNTSENVREDGNATGCFLTIEGEYDGLQCGAAEVTLGFLTEETDPEYREIRKLSWIHIISRPTTFTIRMKCNKSDEETRKEAGLYASCNQKLVDTLLKEIDENLRSKESYESLLATCHADLFERHFPDVFREYNLNFDVNQRSQKLACTSHDDPKEEHNMMYGWCHVKIKLSKQCEVQSNNIVKLSNDGNIYEHCSDYETSLECFCRQPHCADESNIPNLLATLDDNVVNGRRQCLTTGLENYFIPTTTSTTTSTTTLQPTPEPTTTKAPRPVYPPGWVEFHDMPPWTDEEVEFWKKNRTRKAAAGVMKVFFLLSMVVVLML